MNRVDSQLHGGNIFVMTGPGHQRGLVMESLEQDWLHLCLEYKHISPICVCSIVQVWHDLLTWSCILTQYKKVLQRRDPRCGANVGVHGSRVMGKYMNSMMR